MDQQLSLPHKLTLNERSQLIMSAVTEVVSFDDNAVILRTSLGTLLVQGSQLKLKALMPEGGQVTVTGKISALTYEEPKPSGGFWRRLFG